MDTFLKEQEEYPFGEVVLLRGCLVFVEKCASALDDDLEDVWEEGSLSKTPPSLFIRRLEIVS